MPPFYLICWLRRRAAATALLLAAALGASRAQTTPIPAGNVGIGTDAPTQALDVNGNLRVRGLAGGSLLSTTTDRTPEGLPPLLGGAMAAAAPTSLGTVRTGNGPTAIAVNPAGTRAYVLNGTDSNLQAFDLSSGGLPTSLGTVDTDDGPAALALNPAGTRAYVVNSEGATLQVFDISGTGLPANLGRLFIARYSQAIALNAAGTRAYVLNESSYQLQAYDISGSGLPVSLGSVATGTSVRALATNPTSDRVYVTYNGANTLRTYTTSSSLPVSLGTVPTEQNPLAVAVNAAGTRAFVLGLDYSKLQAFDVSGSGLPAALGTATTDSYPTALAVHPAGKQVFVVTKNVSGTGTLLSYDVSGSTPTQLSSVPLPGLGEALTLNPAGTRAYVLAGSSLLTFDLGGPRVAVVNADGSLGSLDPAQLPGYARRAVALGSVGGSGMPLYATTRNYTVAHPATGRYRLSFTPASGLGTQDLSNTTLVATLFNTPGLVSYQAGTGYVDVFTFDPSGAAADRGFSFSLHLP